jgi:hypothetical protein
MIGESTTLTLFVLMLLAMAFLMAGIGLGSMLGP